MPSDEQQAGSSGGTDPGNHRDGSSYSWSRVLFTCTALLGLIVVIVAVARYVPITRHFFTDADTIRVPAGGTTTRDILWQPARTLSDLVNTTVDDYEPRLSSDGLTLYFVRGKAGENADIFVSIKSADGWSEPVLLDGVNSKYDDLGPEPSADGRSMYFYSDRLEGHGGYDLWVAHRGVDGWQTPINLGPSVNSEFNDYGPALTPDGETLYFASNRPAPQDATQPDPEAWRATLREDLFQRTYDLYASAVTDRGFGTAFPLTGLNTPHNDGAPAVSSFGDFLYFASDRPGGEGAFDLYRARRLRGELEPPKNLGDAVNTPANELDPGLSLGGYALYFSSDRFGPAGLANDGVSTAVEREYNLYYTTSREVFAEIERLDRPPIDWAALWARMGPNFLWALLALLLILLLLALLRDMRQRQMGLLAKCLLTSVMAHLLLMLLLNTWEVTAALAKEFRRRGPIQVALASNEVGNDLASQIRGQLTSIKPPEAPTVELERQTIRPEPTATASMASLAVRERAAEPEEQPTQEESPTDASLEKRIVHADLSETQIDAQAPVPLEAALPTDTQRADVQEPEASQLTDRLASAERLEARRAESQSIENWSEAVPTELAPTRLVDATSADVSNQTSMAPIPEAHDAVTETTATPVDPGRFVASANIPAAELTLPTADVQRLPESVETEPRITVPASVAPRREFADASAMEVTVGELRNLKPGSVSRRDLDATLVERAEAFPSDAVPVDPNTRLDGSRSAEAAMPSLAQVDLTLPKSEAAQQTQERSIMPEPELVAHAHARASASSDSSATAPAIDAAEFEPASSANVASDASLAVAGANASHDAPSTSTLQNAGLAVTESAIPAPSDLALPSMEQSTQGALSEREVRVAATESVIPRAAFQLSDEDASGLLLIDELGPAELFDATSDESRKSLAAFSMPVEATRPDAVTLALNVPRHDDFLPADAFEIALDLPTETRPPENPYLQRQVDDRMSIVERMGGSEETERAVADALRWLTRHQSPDGHWDGSDFDDRCGDCGGETSINADNAMTGLALLAFLGAGHTHVTDGPYRSTVRRALRWLVARQGTNGDLRGDETMYSHGIATIAISEAYGMSRDASLAEPVRRAARFIDAARNTDDEGGWRYDPGQAGDTSVLGWQVMALKSATLNSIPVSAESFAAARKWMDRVDRGSRPGLSRYKPDRDVSPSMTAEGMFVRQLLGLHKSDPRMTNAARYVANYLPDWDEANTYFWYYATLALFQQQGDEWERWNEALTSELLENQRRRGSVAGSWDPDGEWADKGGRVYQTALCTLMLEVYYRYLPLYSLEMPEDAIGTIVGSVTDARTGSPLGGATIHVDLPDREAVSAVTDATGRYELFVPEVPAFFAITASRSGYDPDSRNVDAAMLKGRTLAVDFDLNRQSRDVVSIEAVPEVHHLGDNRFDGTINSQFQKESEGDRFEATFEITSFQLPPSGVRVGIRLLAKGVQRSHKIVINGTVLDERLDDAPNDGSFGEFSADFDARLLRAGSNTFEIIAKPSSSDIDDFEFVNVQIQLSP